MEYFVVCRYCGHEFFSSGPVNDTFVCPECGGNFFKEETSYVKKEFKDYYVESLLGKGGMGDVYLATQKSTARKVAIKILKPEFLSNRGYLERFFNEVRTLAKIEHPNVVQALQAGIEDDICYFSMMYIPGKDLKTRLEKGEIFSEDTALNIILAIAKALDFVWRKYKILHRDIKPANIIVTQEGDIKLLDLGISKRISDNSHLTKPGMMIGSPHYVSPEQARGSKDTDFRSDMYSLGATLFHLVTGKTPYEGDNSMSVIASHLKDPIPNPRNYNPNLSEEICILIRKLMAKNREERFASWGELIEYLEEIIRSGNEKQGTTDISKEEKVPSKNKKNSLKKIFAVEFTVYRIIALSIMLVTSLLALYAVVTRSIQDIKHKKAETLYKQAIHKLKIKKDKKTLREVILMLENVQRTQDPEYASMAKEKINEIVKRIVHTIKKNRKKRIERAWERIQEKIAEYETSGEHKKAVGYLKYYLQNGEYKKELKKQIEDYLQSILK